MKNTIPFNILVVEDESTQLNALCDTLRNCGYNCMGVENGYDALDLLGKIRFDIIMVDQVMPGMDGVNLLEAAMLIDPDMAGLIITAYGNVRSAVNAMKVGAVDYIQKPFDINVIIPAIQQALKIRNERISIRQAEKQIRINLEEMGLARERAEAENKIKSEFLNNISHEFRTPLNSIIGFSNILRSKKFLVSLDQRSKFASHIYDASQHLLKIANDILDLAKIEAGHIEIFNMEISLQEIFEECRPMIISLCEKNNVQFLPILSTPLTVLADPLRLKQVLLNLLSNAAKYNRDGGNISLQAKTTTTGRVRITVQDTGLGLTEVEIEQLFQSFNRLGREGSAMNGVGLGLTITRRFVEAMNGEIFVSSVPGIGSEFSFELNTSDGSVLAS